MAVREVASEPLTQLLEQSAEAVGGHPALVDRTRTVTYSELEARSNRVARLLRNLGVARGDRVGLYMEKSLDAVVGLYGVLKTGAAYVPLDPVAPPGRIAQIARDCGLRVLLTGVEKRPQWMALAQAGAPIGALVILNRSGGQDISDFAPPDWEFLTSDDVDAQTAERPHARGPKSDDVAYVLYTSGSTGTPKGVTLTHANAVAFVEWSAREFRLNSEDRLSNHAPLQFDLSVFDLFASAKVGATTVLVPRQTTIFASELVELIEREELTVWYSVPSALTLMVSRGALTPGRLSSLRTVLFAGEVFPPKHLRSLMGLLPTARFANLYGPTETNVCAWHDVPNPPAEDADPVPIGRAIDGTQLFAVTEEGRLCEVGAVGELWVQGPTVMRGYWGDSDSTDLSLIRHPCAPWEGQLAYRTGDLAWRDQAGDYHLVGRRDTQVKSRGYRVELGEIETVLHLHPAVDECAVVALADDVVTSRLAAAVTTSEDVSPAELAAFCSQRLPPYMVPEYFVFRDSLPRTSTGKADREQLADQLRVDQAAGRRARRR